MERRGCLGIGLLVLLAIFGLGVSLLAGCSAAAQPAVSRQEVVERAVELAKSTRPELSLLEARVDETEAELVTLRRGRAAPGVRFWGRCGRRSVCLVGDGLGSLPLPGDVSAGLSERVVSHLRGQPPALRVLRRERRVLRLHRSRRFRRPTRGLPAPGHQHRWRAADRRGNARARHGSGRHPGRRQDGLQVSVTLSTLATTWGQRHARCWRCRRIG